MPFELLDLVFDQADSAESIYTISFQDLKDILAKIDELQRTNHEALEQLSKRVKALETELGATTPDFEDALDTMDERLERCPESPRAKRTLSSLWGLGSQIEDMVEECIIKAKGLELRLEAAREAIDELLRTPHMISILNRCLINEIEEVKEVLTGDGDVEITDEERQDLVAECTTLTSVTVYEE